MFESSYYCYYYCYYYYSCYYCYYYYYSRCCCCYCCRCGFGSGLLGVNCSRQSWCNLPERREFSLRSALCAVVGYINIP